MAFWVAAFARQETNAHKPGHSRHQRHIEQAAGVIEVQIDGLAGHERSDTIEQSCHEEMEVDAAPRSLAPPPHQNQARRQHEFFADIEQVKTSAVHRFRRVHILPRDHDKQIEKQPPRKQKREIESSDSDRAIISAEHAVGLPPRPSWEQCAERELHPQQTDSALHAASRLRNKST